MKKLTVLVLLVVLSVFPVFSNSSTQENLELIGNISPFLSIALSETSIELFNFDDIGLNAQASGSGSVTVTERSNRFSGYTVSVASSNTWKLVNQYYDSEVHNDEFLLPYTYSYDGVAGADYSNASVIITDANSRTVGAGVEKVFAVSVDVPALSPEGQYSDELTFTISAK